MATGTVGYSTARTRTARPAFTLIEVLVVVAIIALLISILLPSLARAKEQARRTICASRLHSMSLAVLEYAHSNQGQIIECRGGSVQVALDPRLAAPGTGSASTPPSYYVDWWLAGKRYFLDKEMWECPNRPGTFAYEGSPSKSVQGYDATELRGRGYTVNDDGYDYDQWILGFQYFGGIKTWETPLGSFKSCSPVDSNSKPSWALAADSNLKVDGYWGGGRPAAFGLIPPHPKADGSPEGGSVLTFDGAVNWIRFGRMVEIHSWDASRDGYWYQSDLGAYGRALHR